MENETNSQNQQQTQPDSAQEQSNIQQNNTQTQTVQTFDDVLNSSKDYQSEFDRRVSQALATAQQKWEQSKIDEQDEAKKLEKMTQAQRESYLLQKDKEAFAKQKAQFAAEQMKVACANELVKRGLDSSFADFITAETAEKTNERLAAFENAFNEAVQAATNNRMRGAAPPKDPETKEPKDPFLMGFTAKN